MMSKEITYELFQESDAQRVADLMNKNRVQAALKKRLTAEDYLFIRRSRGEYFSIIAKKKDRIIGIIGTYPTSIQHVAKKHQVFIGNFLVDIQHRLSYSVIMGLYDRLIKELAKRDFKEILGKVIVENEGAYYLMLKSGFVLLNNTLDDFGYLLLHNYSPALSLYAGADATEVNSNTFFTMLPIVDKKEARKKENKCLIHEKYIECDYMLDGKQVTLLYDIVNLKVDGGYTPKELKVYPDFHTQGNYQIENLGETKQSRTTIEFIMKPESKLDNITSEITLEPGEIKTIPCSKEVSKLKFYYEGTWYTLYPNLFMEEEVLKEPMKFGNEQLEFVLEPSTGFIHLYKDRNKLATLAWPCATSPYLEGMDTPRIKDLKVEKKGHGAEITEDTKEYQLKRKVDFSGNKMEVTTTLQCKVEELNVRPLSQMYACTGVVGYGLQSRDKELIFGSSQIQHRGFGYGDYAYFDAEPEHLRDFTIESISLNYPTSTLEFVIDNKSKPIVHAPLFAFTLYCDKERLLEEQVIEKMEVYYRTEDV